MEGPQDVSNPTPSMGGYPIESVGETPFQAAAPILPLKEKDTIGVSGALPETAIREADKPALDLPDPEAIKTDLHKAIQNLKTNPWLAPSYLALFTAIITEILKDVSKIHYDEALNELKVREDLYKKAEEAGKLAKELMDNQAQEQMVQAVASFSNAFTSTVSFAQTTRNLSAAKDAAKTKITEQQALVKNLEDNASPDTLKGAENPNAVGVVQTPDSIKLRNEREKLQSWQRDEDRLVQDELRHKDTQVQYASEIQRQVINGVSGVLTSMIKTDSGVKEEMQKKLEGLIQAMNKYSESITKARDTAETFYSRTIDLFNKIIDSAKSQTLLSGRAA